MQEELSDDTLSDADIDMLAGDDTDLDITKADVEDEAVAETKADETEETEGDEKPEETEEKDEAEEAETDDDLIEFGEGDDVQQVSLSELVEAYQNPKAADVNPESLPVVQARVQELDTIKEQTRQGLQHMVQERSRWNDGLEQALVGLQTVKQPDRNLLVPNTPQYNPDEYNRQYAEALGAQETRDQLLAVYNQNRQDQESEQNRLNELEREREQKLTVAAWPEYANEDVKNEISSLLSSKYGLTKDEIDSVVSHKFYVMARDVMNYHKGQEAGKKAVAKIKSKSAPRRVKSRKAAAGKPSDITSKINSGKLSNADALDWLTENI